VQLRAFGRSKLKIDIFNPVDRARSNFRWKMAASLFTCAHTISFHSQHDSPVSPNRIRQILNRKSIIAQSDLNSCNSTVIGGTLVNLERVHSRGAFVQHFRFIFASPHVEESLVALLIAGCH